MPTAFGFTGQRKDSYIKLVFLRARYYDPYLNRFISPDTIIPDFTNPQSLNRYSYAFNNPLGFVDPTGHLPGVPPPPSNYYAFTAWMSNVGLPWLYHTYTSNEWRDRYHVDFDTVAQAYVAGEAAAYGQPFFRADTIARKIVSTIPVIGDFWLDSDDKRDFLWIGVKGDLLETDLLFAAYAQETNFRVAQAMGVFAMCAPTVDAYWRISPGTWVPETDETIAWYSKGLI